MKWLKKWCFLILLASTGAVYLAGVNDWQVCAGPKAVVKGWFDGLASEYKNTADGSGNGEKENRPPEGGLDGFGNMLSDGAGTWLPVNGVGGVEPPSGSGSGGSDLRQTSDETAEGDGMAPGDETELPEDDLPGGETPGQGADGQTDPGETGVSYVTVEDDYFADAVFIGDSRTVGMSEYGGLEGISTFYASTGLSVHKMFTAKIVPVQGQKKKITVEEALQENTFSKIYLMIGINEMGTGTVDTFMEKYESAVARLQELQPDAVIYLQGIMKVTAKRSAQGDYITNEGIEERNGRIAQLADNKKIFYLDVNEAVCDETGGMIEDYTHDGVHLKGRYIEVWKQYLKEHAVAL